MALKIGYDAKRAFQNFTGLGNYSRTLIETLAHYQPQNAYILFAPKAKPHARLAAILAQENVKIIEPQGFMKKIAALWRQFFIKKDIQNQQIDIFHGLSHELPALPKGVKSVVTMHDLIHERYPSFYPFFDRKIYTYKFKKACQKADKIVAISAQTRQDLIDFYGVKPNKIQVIYQSCDPQFYLKRPLYTVSDRLHLIEKYGLPPQFVLYVGTANERKNLLGLVKSWAHLPTDNPLCLVAVGSGGRYYETVKSYVAAQNWANKIVFIPKIDFADLPLLYEMANSFALPSFFEGFGIPIIEALWSGTPVITSQGSCFPEAGGPHSLYINPHDSAEIAAAIDRVYRDAPLRTQMQTEGRRYVQRFHEAALAQEWAVLYDQLMSE